jgi:mono/diheme cytochrome c family protein
LIGIKYMSARCDSFHAALGGIEMRLSMLLVLALPGLLAVSGAQAQDVREGQRIAQQWCSGCHQIGTKPVQANDAVPSFYAVAQMTSTTMMSLTVFLSSTHGRMPDYNLTRSEIRNVSSYILSLRKEP